VRYRRQLEMRPPEPIQLQKVKRPSVEMAAQGAPTPTGPAPILLTKKKERKRTLPMDLQIKESAPLPPDAASQPSAAMPNDVPQWLDSDSEEEDTTESEWSDIDIDDANSGRR
jgi:hypothetical protein